MPGTIELVEGIAGAGKTAALLDLHARTQAQSQQELRLGTCLWLTPNRHDAAEITRRLAERVGGVLFAPRVMTFADFANRVLERSAQLVVPLAAGQQRTILRGIIERLREAGEFRHFGPIAASSGFLDLVQSFIAELKRAETWPEVFEAACRTRGGSRRDRELLQVYAAYQDVLLQRRWFDAEGRFWWARETLQSGNWGSFARLELVVVDGFDDFNQTQYSILGLLAERARRMVLSLPGESVVRRGDLFAKTQAVRQELARVAELKPSPLQLAPRPPGESGALAKIARDLFANLRTIQRQADCTGLRIVAVAGQRGEVQWLAAQVKQLLLEGVPAESIVIGFRDVTEYADLLRQIFPAAGIPLELDAPLPLDETPVIRALLLVLNLELHDWEFPRLHDVLRSPFFRPDWLFANEAAEGWGAVGATLAALRRLQLGENRERILEVLRHDAEQAPTPGKQRQSATALRVLRQLDQMGSAMRNSQPLTGWGGVLRGLEAGCGLLRQAGEHPEDARHWNQALDALFAAGKVEPETAGGFRRLDLAAFLREFGDLLRQQTADANSRTPGGVRVLPVAEIRNLEIPRLFLAGLNEQSFPRRRSDDCLYGEAERRQLNEHGLALGHHTLRAQEEMLLFYRVATRARVELTLSYPAVSSDGEPLSPSPYLAAVRDLYEPGCPLVTFEEQLDPVPRAGRVLSHADLRVRAMHDALEGRPGLLAASVELPGVQESLARTFAAVDLNIRRFHERGFTNAEGLLARNVHRNWLQGQFPRDREFSATHLELYGQCPFRFFVEQVLAVEPLEEIGFATDHGERGQLIHRVLARVHQERLVLGRPPTRIPTGLELATRFTEILAEMRGNYPAGDPLHAVMADLEFENLEEWGGEYGAQWDRHIGRCQGVFEVIPQPMVFEKSFGTRSRPSDTAETGEAAVEEAAPKDGGELPVVVGPPGREVLLTGRIDRIDVGIRAGRPVCMVVDYKSGSKKSLGRKDVAQGRNLQLPLYLLATLERELAGPELEPAQAAFWYLRDEGFTPGLRAPGKRGKKEEIDLLSPEDWEQTAEILEWTVPRIVEGIQQGEFPVFNHDRDCTRFCPHSLACRVSQIRAVDAALSKSWTLESAGGVSAAGGGPSDEDRTGDAG